MKAGHRNKGRLSSSRTLSVVTRHSPVTAAWSPGVEAVKSALERSEETQGAFTAECEVVLFEIPGDDQLHVNVIHAYPRAAPVGWSGPGRLAEGCVYNRRFPHAPASQIIRRVREMVFA